MIAADDPVTCAAYAKDHNLLTLEEWQRFKGLAQKYEILARAIRQSQIIQVSQQIPNTYVRLPNP